VKTAEIDRKWTPSHPELGTGPLLIETCTSEAYFEQERDLIFRRVWLNVGRVERIPEPSDYFVKDLAVARTSIVLVRGRDGVVRAFHNMCSHRGNKLAWAEGGQARRFTCKFHGWSYDLAGKLVGVPDEDQFFDFDKREHGLTQISAEVWNGFIFINLDPQPKESLEAFLGELGKQIDGYPFDELSTSHFSYVAEVKVNWKVAMDAFQEAYHAPFLHKASIAYAFKDKENPLLHGITFQVYPRHHMISLYGNPEHHPTPVETVAHRFGPTMIPREVLLERLPAGVNPARSPNWAFDINVIFPNFNLGARNGTYRTYNFWPLAVDRTLIEISSYYPRAENPGQRFSREYAKCVHRDTVMEDLSTLEHTQSILASGAKSHFVLSDQEVLVRHFHRVVQDYAGSYEAFCTPKRKSRKVSHV